MSIGKQSPRTKHSDSPRRKWGDEEPAERSENSWASRLEENEGDYWCPGSPVFQGGEQVTVSEESSVASQSGESPACLDSQLSSRLQE